MSQTFDANMDAAQRLIEERNALARRLLRLGEILGPTLADAVRARDFVGTHNWFSTITLSEEDTRELLGLVEGGNDG